MSDHNPRICFLLRYFAVGGLERVVIGLANSLASLGIDTTVVVMSASRRNALISELSAGVKVELLRGSPLGKLFALRRLTRGAIVHIHFGDGHVHPLVRLALLRRSVAVTCHSVYRHKRTWVLNRMDQLFALQATGIIAVSNAVKDFCCNDVKISPQKVVVIQNGIDLERTARDCSDAAISRLQNSSVGNCITLISLASMYKHKNQVLLLDALAILRQRGFNVRLRLVGDGPNMAECYRRCLELGVQDIVDWYGAIWRRDMVEPLLKTSDIFVSSSNFEGLPISLLEGMRCGLPMVLSDIPSHRETASYAAEYFPQTEPTSLADCLVTLISDGKRLASLRQASADRVRAFDISLCVHKHLDFYRGMSGLSSQKEL